MKTLSAGPDGVFPPGAERDLDENAARDMIRDGFAEEIPMPSQKPQRMEAEETSTNDPRETTSRRVGRSIGRRGGRS